MIIGIDPGAKGGEALITSRLVYAAWPYSADTLITHLKGNPEAICYIEKVHAMPGQGVTSMFNFGRNYGEILGILKAFNIKVIEVPPQRWKKEFDLIGKDKKASIDKAKELFPEANLKRTPRCRTDSDGIAEALLIAEYGRRQNV